MYLKHDSWDTFYKDPFGAIPIGEKVTFRVKSSDTINIRLHLQFRDSDNYYDMVQTPWDPETYEVTVEMPNSAGLVWYDFHFDAFNSHYVYGAPPDGIGGEGQVNLFSTNSYQITVYDPKRKVPDWYKEGIIYQIFPDRFSHGERDDFKPEYRPNSLIHANWDDSPHYFRREDNSIEYWDFFGGNLQGIIDKLDYLKDLGVSIIYLNPIFDSETNHKYDTADYKKIAPEFGNEEIFIELTEEAKKRGIRIILDGVFNHTGINSKYFDYYGIYPEVGAYESEESPYYTWYNFTNYPDEYESWWGIKSMPSLNKNNPDLQHYIYEGDNSVVRNWIKKGASGWRLDVADELPDEFIVGIKEAMMTENPDTVLIGEVWEDASNKISYGKLRDYFLGRELDSVMNYPFRDALLGFFRGHLTSSESMRKLVSLYEHYPIENFMSNMNLIGSHDRKRALTAVADLPDTDYMSERERENFKLDESQLRIAKERLKQLVLIQMTFPGVPVIYYGDELGTQGLEDPFNRSTFNWENRDEELLDWYKTLTSIRNNSDVFKKGRFSPIQTPEDVFAFKRFLDDDEYIILVNRNPYKDYKLDLSENELDSAVDILSKKEFNLDSIKLDPFGKLILKI